MYDLKNIEVCGNCGEKYPAELLEVNDKYVKIKYNEGNNLIQNVSPKFVYYGPNKNNTFLNINLPELMAGTLVDVFCMSDTLPFTDAKNNNMKVKAWWPGIVRKRQGELVVVDLLLLNSCDSFDITSDDLKIMRQEIVDLDFVRIRSEGINFNQRPLKWYKLEIPPAFRNSFKNNDYELDLKRWCGEMIAFSKSSDLTYITVYTWDEAIIHKVKLIGRKWVQQWAAKFSLTQQVEDSRNKKQELFEEIFSVDKNLLGFAYGEESSNLNTVNQMPDVVSAQLIDQNGRFSVVAKSKTALKLARAKLEIVESFVKVSKPILNILVTVENGKLLYDVVKKCDLLRIIIMGNDLRERLSQENRCINSPIPIHTNEDKHNSGFNTTFHDTLNQPVDSDEEFILISLTGNRQSVNLAKKILHFTVDNLENQWHLRQSILVDMDSEFLNDVKVHWNIAKTPESTTQKRGFQNGTVQQEIKKSSEKMNCGR